MLGTPRSQHGRLWYGVVATGALELLAALAHADPAAPSAAPDLQPPKITVLQSKPGTAPGLIFVAPKTSTSGPQGPEIIDDQGRPVWFQPVLNGDQATDFRVQRYHGQPVLTWWQGHADPGHGQGTSYVVDDRYHVIASVKAGNGLDADLHEFRLTPQGTALITIYHQVARDLSAVGGPADGTVFDGVVQEIDVATGKVVFEWHSLDHVGLEESHAPLPASASTPYDYFHINAANLDVDGNLLIDARNTWTVYKVDRRTGQVIARLGGKKTDFTLGTDVEFAWQHDPEPVDANTVRIFDNEAGPAVRPHSRVIWVRRDLRTHSATLLRSIEHPDGLLAPSQGNSQALELGHTFVGWGQLGRFSELDALGNLLFDANVPADYDNYRAYRSVWHAHPDTLPIAKAQRNTDGTLTVHAIWNGATEVVRWYVVGGSDSRALWPLGSAAWNGLDTAIAVKTSAQRIAVVAQDAWGRLIGRSLPVLLSE